MKKSPQKSAGLFPKLYSGGLSTRTVDGFTSKEPFGTPGALFGAPSMKGATEYAHGVMPAPIGRAKKIGKSRG